METRMPARRAGPDDAGLITAFQNAAYMPNREILGVEPLPLLVDYAAIIRDMEAWLFEKDKVAAGVLILKSEPGQLLIWSVATHPDHQGTGLGRTMMDFADRRALELDLPQIRLYTGSRLVERILWYERLGYKVERLEDLPDRQITHMMK